MMSPDLSTISQNSKLLQLDIHINLFLKDVRHMNNKLSCLDDIVNRLGDKLKKGEFKVHTKNRFY